VARALEPINIDEAFGRLGLDSWGKEGSFLRSLNKSLFLSSFLHVLAGARLPDFFKLFFFSGI